jgi:hypothetical protein
MGISLAKLCELRSYHLESFECRSSTTLIALRSVAVHGERTDAGGDPLEDKYIGDIQEADALPIADRADPRYVVL